MAHARRTRSLRRSRAASACSNALVSDPAAAFDGIREQDAVKLLLSAALREGPAHAYLFHGPSGVGKRAMARAFAGALLGDARRVERGTHPDLYVLEPLGEQIRIGDVHALRHDLHLRPFETDRRVYIIHGADAMNPDASDALLKSLEEPPSYATVVLVADHAALLPDTIRSRCQMVPFRRLSRAAIAGWLLEQEGQLSQDEVPGLARAAGGTLERAQRLLEPDAAKARLELIDVVRASYRDPAFAAPLAVQTVLDRASARGEEARARAKDTADDSLTAREADQRERRAARGAEREHLIEAVETVATWCRDLVVATNGATGTAINADLTSELDSDAALVSSDGAEIALEAALETRRRFELQLQAPLALDALFVSLRRAMTRVETTPVG